MVGSGGFLVVGGGLGLVMGGLKPFIFEKFFWYKQG